MKMFGFIGAGTISQAIIDGWIQSGQVPVTQIGVSNRSSRKVLNAKKKWGVRGFASNEELVDHCDVIFFCTKPQDITAAVESIPSFHKHHIVISLAAGISLYSLKKLIPSTSRLIRVMTNLPISIQKAVVGYSLLQESSYLESLVEELFSSMGLVIKVDEGEALEALTVATSSGVGLVLEQMIYWQEWLEEYGFAPEVAKEMTLQTFLGTAHLVQSTQKNSLVELQDQVTSKKGVTAAGLRSMRELEMSRILRVSFEKAVLRDRELGTEI